MEVKINDEVVTLKYGFRALMMFEKITGKTFQGGGLNDALTLFYCCYVAGNLDTTVTFDDFIDYLDNNPNEVVRFTEWLSKRLSVEGNITEQKDGKETKEKGKAKKK